MTYLWDLEKIKLYYWDEIKNNFKLENREQCIWEKILVSILNVWSMEFGNLSSKV
jgi:hypothetical protein